MNDNNKVTVTISSHLEMVGFLKSNGTACRFVGMVSETEPKLKKGCPFKGVLKISRKTGLINANYNTAVRNRIAEKLGVSVKDVEYENGDVWYQHLKTNDGKALPLVVNKKAVANGEAAPTDGKYYFQYYPHSSSNVYKMPNGDVIPEADLEPWFYKRSERDGFKPVVIAVAVENVKELRASGVIMQAEDIAEAEAALAMA